MKVEEVILLLKKMGVENINRKGNQLQISCPLSNWFHTNKADNRPSMGVKVEETDVVFHCFSCGETGKFWQLLDSYGLLSGKIEFRKIADEVFEKNQPNRLLIVQQQREDLQDWFRTKEEKLQKTVSEDFLLRFSEVSGEAMEYLNSRKYDFSTVAAFDLKYDYVEKRLVYPVRNYEGILTGAQGRTIIDDKIKYKNYFGFLKSENFGGLELFDASLSRIFLVEGFFCMIRSYSWCKEVDANVLCTFGADVSEQQLRILSEFNRPTVCFFDNDKAGDAGWEKLKFLKVPSLKRAGLTVGVDVDKMIKDEFMELEKKLRRIPSVT